jgi:arylesterase/paraoxonase
MKIIKGCVIGLAAVVLIAGSLLLKTCYDAGEFKEIKARLAGNCRTISGVQSSEDIVIDRVTGMAFISSTDRRPEWTGVNSPGQGAIFGFDLKNPASELIHFTSEFTKEFNPHGIGLWRGQDGKLLLFAVNHCREGHFIEIFEKSGMKLIHRESISGGLMHSPNDVAPTGARTFYVTNDHGYTTRWGRMVEEYLQLAKGSLLYYDGNAFEMVAKGLAYANGINLSADGLTVYAAATVGQKILVYNRERETGRLTPRQTVDLGTGPDNIDVDENGNLWIGCHPKLLTFVAYSKDPEKLSPSQVIKIFLRKPGEYSVEEMYLSNGETLSGSSVAAVFENTLLIGSVFDERFLQCKLP